MGSAGHNVTVSIDGHTRVRNYLIVQMGVNNATRTGALTNMKVEHVRNAQKVGGTYVIQVILKCLFTEKLANLSIIAHLLYKHSDIVDTDRYQRLVSMNVVTCIDTDHGLNTAGSSCTGTR